MSDELSELPVAPYLVILTFTGTPSRDLDKSLGDLCQEPPKLLVASTNVAVLGVSWSGNAEQLWKAMSRLDRFQNTKDILIVEGGHDWCNLRDRSASGWLVRHLGDPLAWKTQG